MFGKNLMIIASTVLCAVFAGPSLAHGDGPHRRGAAPIDEIDVDGDGAITRDEMEAFRGSAFARADGDGDGALTPEELSAAHEARRQERRQERRNRTFQAIDRDGDGVVSQSEFMAREAPFFDRIDKNGDGVLSAEELADRPHRRRRH